MITALVQFPLPAELKQDEVLRFFAQAAPDFRRPEGLIRKYFVLSDDGRSGGGVYLWRLRVLAVQFYESGFRQLVEQLFGSAPTITYFETPLVVDNLTGEIIESPLATIRMTTKETPPSASIRLAPVY
jgi:hypothetical protein